MEMFIFFVAALSSIRLATGQLNTELVVMYSAWGFNGVVERGSTIVFSCTIPGLGNYTGPFNYTELHAIVGGADLTICSATATGPCAQGSQEAPYTSRSITVNITDTVESFFTMAAAVVGDSGDYYCKIFADGVLYTQAPGVTTQLLVYAGPSESTLSFVNSSNAFVSGQALPQITCTANVGAPYGWLELQVTGFIGTSSTAQYPNYMTLVTNSTVVESDGTYTITNTYAYSTGTYVLSSNNDNDTFWCQSCNHFLYNLGSSYCFTSELTMRVQSPVTGIAVNMALYRGALPLGSTLLQRFVQSGTWYTLTVSQGTVITLYCSAQGHPTPTYQWTQLSGQNAVAVTSSSSQASSTLSIAETLTLQCNASNTISITSPSYGTSQTATVNIIVH